MENNESLENLEKVNKDNDSVLFIDLKDSVKKLFISSVNEICEDENLEKLDEELLATCMQKGNEKEESDISIAVFKLAKHFGTNPNELSQKIAAKMQSKIDSIFNELEIEEIQLENDNEIEVEDEHHNHENCDCNHDITQIDLSEILLQFEYAGIDKIFTTGPYINIKYDKLEVFNDTVIKTLFKGSKLGENKENRDKTVVIDYSSPNIAKQFHIGHLKTTVIGSMLYKLHKQLGYKVVGVNHIGDYGTQFGKLIEGYNLWKSEYTFENPIEDLTNIYIRINELCKTDEEVFNRCKDNFKKLEEGDVEVTNIWKMFIDYSLKEFNKIYDVLNVKFDEIRGESAYSNDMPLVVKELNEKGLLKESEGLQIVDLENEDLGVAVIQKSNGSSMYLTRDIATFEYRANTYDFEKSLYVVATEQTLHFKQLFKIMEKLGYDKKYINGAKHIPYGMVSLPTGKMSTRLGNVIKIEELIEEAISKTHEKLSNKDNLTDEEKEKISKQVGVGAIIFYNLSTQLIKDQVFVWDNVLDFTGDTGPYVQYVNVRINSIINDYINDEEYIKTDKSLRDLIMLKLDDKSDEKLEIIEDLLENIHNEENINTLEEMLNQKEVYNVFKSINEFENILNEAANRYEPYILTSYLIELSKNFNQYYNLNKILTKENETKRKLGIIVCVLVSTILKTGMNILGIDMPEKM